MKNKAIIAAALCAVNSISNAGAFGGTYPVTDGYTPFNEAPLYSNKNQYTPSEEKNLFTVNGKTFILLDTDEDGNYFVMTEDHYGRKAFAPESISHMPLETATLEDDTYVFTPENTMNVNNWIFNPENPASIAYWLNNDFYKKGNGLGKILPDSIKDNILERTWGIEGFKSYYATGKARYDNFFNGIGVTGYSTSKSFADNIYCEPYNVTCKIALMSYTEYVKYQKLIGISFGHGTWGGMMLRSQDNFVTANVSDEKRVLVCYHGALQVTRQTSTEDVTKPLKINIADAISADGYFFVRPVFWLDKDFFKKVKCETDSLGMYPLEFIRNHSYEELSLIYSEDEMKKIGMYHDDGGVGKVKPYVDRVDIFGDVAVGKKITAQYDFDKNSDATHEGLNEFGSKYRWYVSTSANGDKLLIENADEITFTPTEEHAGKFLWFSVTPRNAFTNQGETVFSKKAIKVRDANEVYVTFKNSDGTEITTLQNGGEFTTEIKYSLNNESAVIYILKYNRDRQLTLMKVENVEGSGNYTDNISVAAGESVKIMVLNKSGGSPYCVYDLK